MNTRAIQRIGLLAGVLLISVQFLSAADKWVYLGLVGAQFFDGKEKGSHFDSDEELEELARESLAERELLRTPSGLELVLVSRDAAPVGQAPTEALMQDTFLGEAPVDRYADSIAKVRASLSEKQWDETVRLWANVLTASARFVKSAQRKKYAGPLLSLGQLGLDATRVVWVPVLYVTCAGSDTTDHFGEMFIGTVPSVLSDVGFLLPSTFLKARYHVSLSWNERKLLHAVHAFKKHVEKTEQALGIKDAAVM